MTIIDIANQAGMVNKICEGLSWSKRQVTQSGIPKALGHALHWTTKVASKTLYEVGSRGLESQVRLLVRKLIHAQVPCNLLFAEELISLPSSSLISEEILDTYLFGMMAIIEDGTWHSFYPITSEYYAPILHFNDRIREKAVLALIDIFQKKTLSERKKTILLHSLEKTITKKHISISFYKTAIEGLLALSKTTRRENNEREEILLEILATLHSMIRLFYEQSILPEELILPIIDELYQIAFSCPSVRESAVLKLSDILHVKLIPSTIKNQIASFLLTCSPSNLISEKTVSLSIRKEAFARIIEFPTADPLHLLKYLATIITRKDYNPVDEPFPLLACQQFIHIAKNNPQVKDFATSFLADLIGKTPSTEIKHQAFLAILESENTTSRTLFDIFRLKELPFPYKETALKKIIELSKVAEEKSVTYKNTYLYHFQGTSEEREFLQQCQEKFDAIVDILTDIVIEPTSLNQAEYPVTQEESLPQLAFERLIEIANNVPESRSSLCCNLSRIIVKGERPYFQQKAAEILFSRSHQLYCHEPIYSLSPLVTSKKLHLHLRKEAFDHIMAIYRENLKYDLANLTKDVKNGESQCLLETLRFNLSSTVFSLAHLVTNKSEYLGEPFPQLAFIGLLEIAKTATYDEFFCIGKALELISKSEEVDMEWKIQATEAIISRSYARWTDERKLIKILHKVVFQQSCPMNLRLQALDRIFSLSSEMPSEIFDLKHKDFLIALCALIDIGVGSLEEPLSKLSLDKARQLLNKLPQLIDADPRRVEFHTLQDLSCISKCIRYSEFINIFPTNIPLPFRELATSTFITLSQKTSITCQSPHLPEEIPSFLLETANNEEFSLPVRKAALDAIPPLLEHFSEESTSKMVFKTLADATNISDPFSQMAIDQLLQIGGTKPQFLNDCINTLQGIFSSHNRPVTIRTRAATGLITLSQNHPLPVIAMRAVVRALSDILASTEEFHLLYPAAFNRLRELANTAIRINDDERLAYIVDSLVPIASGQTGSRAMLARFSPLARNALLHIADISPRFRETIRYRLHLSSIQARPAINATAALATERQNVHTASVHSSVASSIENLYKRYPTIDEEKTLSEFRTFLNKVHFPDLEDKRPDALACFERLQSPPIAETIESSSNVSMHKILCLVWTGINDLSIHSPQDIQSCLRNIIIHLETIQNQYGPGHPSCIGGTFNQVIAILEDYHPDVQIVRLTPGLMSDIVKDSLIELFMKKDIEIQKLLLRTEIDPKILDPFLQNVQDLIKIRIAELGGVETPIGICVRKECIMSTKNFEEIINKQFLREQLTITKELIHITIEKVAQDILLTFPTHIQEMLKHPEKAAFSKEVFADFASQCRIAIQKRIETLGALYNGPRNLDHGLSL